MVLKARGYQVTVSSCTVYFTPPRILQRAARPQHGHHDRLRRERQLHFHVLELQTFDNVARLELVGGVGESYIHIHTANTTTTVAAHTKRPTVSSPLLPTHFSTMAAAAATETSGADRLLKCALVLVFVILSIWVPQPHSSHTTFHQNMQLRQLPGLRAEHPRDLHGGHHQPRRQDRRRGGVRSFMCMCVWGCTVDGTALYHAYLTRIYRQSDNKKSVDRVPKAHMLTG